MLCPQRTDWRRWMPPLWLGMGIPASSMLPREGEWSDRRTRRRKSVARRLKLPPYQGGGQRAFPEASWGHGGAGRAAALGRSRRASDDKRAKTLCHLSKGDFFLLLALIVIR